MFITSATRATRITAVTTLVIMIHPGRQRRGITVLRDRGAIPSMTSTITAIRGNRLHAMATGPGTAARRRITAGPRHRISRARHSRVRRGAPVRCATRRFDRAVNGRCALTFVPGTTRRSYSRVERPTGPGLFAVAHTDRPIRCAGIPAWQASIGQATEMRRVAPANEPMPVGERRAPCRRHNRRGQPALRRAVRARRRRTMRRLVRNRTRRIARCRIRPAAHLHSGPRRSLAKRHRRGWQAPPPAADRVERARSLAAAVQRGEPGTAGNHARCNDRLRCDVAYYEYSCVQARNAYALTQ